MDKKIIGERLTSLRGEKTQKEVADAVGIAQSTYAMYESGRRRATDENKIALANYFRKTVQEIFF